MISGQGELRRVLEPCQIQNKKKRRGGGGGIMRSYLRRRYYCLFVRLGSAETRDDNPLSRVCVENKDGPYVTQPQRGLAKIVSEVS